MHMFCQTGTRAKATAVAVAAGLLCLAPKAVLAEGEAGSVTIVVPLQITGLVPQADTAQVNCLISKVEIGGAIASETNVLGRGSTSVRLAGGAYGGDVRVPVTLKAVYRPELVRSYSCRVTIHGSPIPPATARWYANGSRMYADITGHTITSSGWWEAESNYRIP